jgi:hypothetical protein
MSSSAFLRRNSLVALLQATAAFVIALPRPSRRASESTSAAQASSSAESRTSVVVDRSVRERANVFATQSVASQQSALASSHRDMDLRPSCIEASHRHFARNGMMKNM